ncbi:hypothetical protein C0J52_16423 [Blattella germanica]|nr:hypothetical protein C0J52_16423 [Blattella germanica]
MGLLKLWHRIFNVVTLATIMIAFHIGGCVQEVTVRQEANAIIGAVMQVSERGNGVFGCGSPIEKEIVKYEAVRWVVSVLNQKTGVSFLPNISLGVRVYDTCGRFRAAVTQLGEFLPALKGVNNSFFIPSTLKLGLLDDAGLSEDPEVQEALTELQFPVVKLDPEMLVISADEKAKAIHAMIKTLNWHHLMIVHGDDAFSTHVANFLIQLSGIDDSPCILSMEQYMRLEKLKSNEEEAAATVNLNSVHSLLAGSSTGIPIVAILHQSTVRNFLESVKEYTHSNNVTSLQVLFSDLLMHEDIEIISQQALKKKEIYPTQENEWLWKLVKSQSPCLHQTDSSDIETTQDCTEDMNERVDDDLHVALRAEKALVASQGVVVFARALQNAWKVICVNGNKQPCPELMSIAHKDFEELYVKEVLQNQRNGLKLPQDDEDWLNESGDVPDLILIMAYNPEDGVRLLDNNFQPTAIETCLDDSQNCGSCLHASHDRAIAGRRLGLIEFESQLLQPKYRIQYSSEDYRVLIPSPQNLYIAGLFAVHKGTDRESLLKCNRNELELKTVREVEAFLWALHKVNAHVLHNLGGLKLGALLIDTCSSRVRTMMLAAGLDSFSNKVRQVNSHNILAVVNALALQDAKVANEILSRMNISTLSTGQAAAVLDVEAPLSSMVDAIVDVLKYLGWNYLSVIYSVNDSEYSAGYKMFQEAASKSGICIALEEGITPSMKLDSHFSTSGTRSELMNQLVGARARGARAVLLWTHPEHTEDLMQAVGQEIAHGSLRREDLFWLIASPNGQAPQILRKFGNVLGGALIFRPQHRPVQEFQHHLQHIHHNPRGASKNPWILKYYQEGLMCNEPECKLLLEMSSHDDFNTVQAVYSIGAALASTFSQLCRNDTDVTPDSSCLSLLNRMEIRAVLNDELHRTNAKRADGSSTEDFQFTNEGMGNIPVEILNYRRNSRSRSRTLADIYFERCNAHSNCPRCKRRYDSVALSDWVTMMKPKENDEQERKQDVVVYIAATLSVHEPSRNPLECGGEVSKQGIEQLEAFLWAIDQVNRNNSHFSLAAIALDTCGSIVKTSRDVSNFLNQQDNNVFEKWNTTEMNIVALLAGGDSELAGTVTDAVGHLGVAVLAPQAGGPPAQRKKYAPYPLQLAPSNVVRAASLLALLHHLQWNCFSIMYHQDGVEYEDMFRYIEKHAASSIQLELTSGIPIPLASLNVTSLLRKCIMMLRAQKVDGSRIVVLLLPPDRMELIFRIVKSLEDEDMISPGDFTWIMVGSEENFEYSEESAGSIILQPKAGRVLEFEDHFRSLSLSSNSWNPWFSEFWSSVFHCRGATCHSDLYQDLHSYQFSHNPLVVNTINSVLAISHALGTVKRELCPGNVEFNDGSLCKAMYDIARVKRRLFEVAPHMAFVGVGLNAVAFSSAGENSHADIEVSQSYFYNKTIFVI